VESFKEEGPADVKPCGPLWCTACLIDSYPISPKTSAVIGTAGLYVADTTTEIWNVAVAPEHRRKGHCKTLIKALVALVQTTFPDKTVRIVVHRDNPIQFGYQKMGFTTKISETPLSILLEYTDN
jgi:ribosomal protein S18 acetylase RimI-like enzyme